MNQQLTVTKRDGRKETIELDKLHRVITWAAEGLENVSVSQSRIEITHPVLRWHQNGRYPRNHHQISG